MVSLAGQRLRGAPASGHRGVGAQRPDHHKLLRAVEEFHIYIENNQLFIPNYGERYRRGERISTGFVESAVNYVVAKRFSKRQQMQWSPKGDHLLLQMRTQVLNGELEQTFPEWHPGCRAEGDEKLKKAA